MTDARPGSGDGHDGPRRLLDTDDRRARVRAYHERTKHHFRRFAAGPGYLDWDNQPDPFRRYAGAPRVALPLAQGDEPHSFEELFVPGRVAPRALDLDALGLFFELALGLSAWKEIETARWALRNNPSSGNLHPTEGYLISPSIDGLEAGVYHYASREHSLERRAILQHPLEFPPESFLVGLSSIHWRESWKYGERAFRYCQHDIGHAIASFRMSAAVLGWTCRLLGEPADDEIEAILGLRDPSSLAAIDPADREEPDLLLLIAPPAELEEALARAAGAIPRLAAAMTKVTWLGVPNGLSPTHRPWAVIDDVAAACRKPRTAEMGTGPDFEPALAAPVAPAGAARPGDPGVSASKLRPVPISGTRVIRQRRSCLSLDGVTRQSRDSFFRVLARLAPHAGVPPWDALPWPPGIHLLLFVHMVDDLDPGLYLLGRRPGAVAGILAAGDTPYAPEPVPGLPEPLELVLLDRNDFRHTARAVSCTQDIAADGTFSVGMIAEYESTLADGSWHYRRLFWEAGVLGHLLYLGVEAEGLRGTGIGCYFDDPVHQLLGLTDRRFQSLYHFTAGGPVDDPRLRTVAAYAHLKR